MAETATAVAVVTAVPEPILPRPNASLDPPAPFTSWCDWAKAGFQDALNGMQRSGGGVTEYHIGSRGLTRGGPADQIKNVDYWNEMVKYFCGVTMLPPSLTGRDTAARIVPRDV